MKSLLITALFFQVLSTQAFASQELCVAYETKTSQGFSSGYDVNCVGRPTLMFADKFRGRKKTLNLVIAKMNDLGLEIAQTFEGGEVLFTETGSQSGESYLLARGFVSGPGQYSLKISDGIKIEALTFSDLNTAALAFDLKFVRKFSTSSKRVSYVLYKRSVR